MSVSVDGFTPTARARSGGPRPGEELFRFHVAQVREPGGYLCGRRLWRAIPKVVFSRTLDRVQGNRRLAEASGAEEVAAARDATDDDVSIGGAGPAAAAIELGLVDELRTPTPLPGPL